MFKTSKNNKEAETFKNPLKISYFLMTNKVWSD